MKSAIISGVILLCIVLIITANSFYCIGTISELEELANSDAAVTEAGVEALDSYWRKHKLVLHLGVNTEYVDSISESIVSLKAAIKTNSEADIATSLSLLNFRLEQLKKLNELELENIF